jgi:hypothetical protein
MIALLMCLLRGRGHNPVRHPLGGFKCADCGKSGADLERMGFLDGGYVSTLRTTYDRQHGTVTRSDWRDVA